MKDFLCLNHPANGYVLLFQDLPVWIGSVQKILKGISIKGQLNSE